MRVVSTVAVILALQALAVALYQWVERDRRGSEVHPFRYERMDGRPMLPDAGLERFDGTTLLPTALLGQPVLLHFWATWCPPCVEELPGLLELGREHPGLRVVAISLDEEWATIGGFFRGPIPPEVFREPSGVFVRHFEVGTLPDTYLLDSGGAARFRFGGARDWRSHEARALPVSFTR